ncbi:hypothetical protein KQI42_01000 [Tissierella sp. MSJ-40]|uniref:Uncharacterized protein n=1 Tax=Tissierella simiarum TaxID=2841534 RepID=A0ABS6E0Z1_9FIRM|nr:hypothetical protein [Tissierella simiarum]MBU5436562.1 hypothetical protein [Tissierella simiarum]
MKKFFRIFVLGLIITCVSSLTIFAESPNYGKSTESKPIGLFFTGYIQCKPSYYDSRGGHAAFGWFQYENTADESRYYTDVGKSKYDSSIYSREKTVRDIWGFGHDKAIFKHGFFWTGNGENWPQTLFNMNLNKLNLKPVSIEFAE